MNLQDSQIRRLIFHRVFAKNLEARAFAVPTQNIVEIDDPVAQIIKKRITNACGKPTKSFEVEIEDEEKFLHYAKTIKNANDQEFIDFSGTIAHVLAENQTSHSANEGFLFVVDGVWPDGRHYCALIKASFDDGVTTIEIDGKSTMQIINQLLLSSNQKLFKIGVLLEEINADGELVDRVILFDDQINTGSKPAIYFYNGFLGLNLNTNPKKKTEAFFFENKAFITRHIPDDSVRLDTLNGLVAYMKSQETQISALDFCDRHIPPELRDLYEETIIRKYPHSSAKDLTMIRTALRYKTMKFARAQVEVKAPADLFDRSVEFIRTQDRLRELQVNEGYSILKIIGRPDSDE